MQFVLRFTFLGVTILMAVGCASDRSPSTAAGTQADPCVQYAQVESIPENYRVLILGELHGTAESPAVVQSFICEYTKTKATVLVLEAPKAAIDAVFMDPTSADSSKADFDKRIAASNAAFWNRPPRYQDGKASEAWAALLQFVVELNSKGTRKHVSVLGVDPNAAATRIELMDKSILELSQTYPDRQVIVLLGNFHARRIRASIHVAADAAILRRNILVLNMAHAGGTAWLCEQDGCAEKSVGPSHAADSGIPHVRWSLGDWDKNFDGIYWLATVTASPPACVRLTSCKVPGKPASPP